MMLVLNKRLGAVESPTHIYVGRPSPWGNPYGVGQLGANNTSTREDAIEMFRSYAERRLQRQPDWLDPLRSAEALICWCAPEPCHAEVLVRLIEGTSDQ